MNPSRTEPAGARELAHGLAHMLHPVQMATCMCDDGKTRAPGQWCAKVMKILTAAFEARDAQHAVELAELRAETIAQCAREVLKDADVHWNAATQSENDGRDEDAETSEAIAMGLQELAKRIRALKETP